MAERSIPFASSSNCKSVVYDDETQTLTVSFNNGGTYRYYGVSSQTADGFAAADSAGKYLHSFIKNQHQYEKIG